MKRHCFQKIIAGVLIALIICAVCSFNAFASTLSNPAVAELTNAEEVKKEMQPVTPAELAQITESQEKEQKSEIREEVLESIRFLHAKLTLEVGKSTHAAFVSEPENVQVAFSFTSSNSDVVRVDSAGVITAVAVGIAEITIHAGDVSDTMVVTVVKSVISAKQIAFFLADFSVAQGETVKTGLVVQPANAEKTAVRYASSNESVLRVDKNGVVTGIKPGKVYIVAKMGNLKAYAFIEVTKAPTSIYLNYTNVKLGLHEKSLDLNAHCKGGYAFIKTFRSTNTKIIKVDRHGVVEAVGIGKAYVVSETFNGKRAVCTITVGKQPTAVKFKNTKEVYQIGTMHPAADFKLNKGAVAHYYKITSSNPKVVRVLKNGKVKARSIGKAVLTVTLYNGLKAQKVITVKNNIVLSINKQALIASCFCDSVERYIYGYSYQNRPLEAYIINGDNYKKTLFIDFAIHGFEDDSYRDGKYLTDEGNKLVAYYAKYFAQLKDYRLVVVPCANPDGVIAGKNNLRACSTAFGRCTANHVDMNRDFLAKRAKETRALIKVIDRYKPDVYLNAHGWLDETLGTASLCSIVNDALGLSKSLNGVYAYWDGYAIGYVRDTYGIPCCLIEYKSPQKVVHRKTVNMINRIVMAY